MSSIQFTGSAFFPTVSGVSSLKTTSETASENLPRGNNFDDMLTLSPVNTQPETINKLNLLQNWQPVTITPRLPNRVPSYDAVNAVFEGIWKSSDYSVSKQQVSDDGFTVTLQAYNPLKPSEKLKVQALVELSEKSLNDKISNILDKTEIIPDGDGKLDFSLDQDGLVKITSGIEDSEQKQKLESILNADEGLKQDLMIYQARKSIFANKFTLFSPRTNAVIFDVYERMNGRNPAEAEGVNKSGYTLDFSFQNGKIFQGEAPKDSVFNSRLDSLAGLAEVIGINPENTGSVQDFSEALKNNIDEEETALTGKINAVLGKAGLADLTRKITFSTDKDGNITVEGNVRPDKLNQLQQQINADTELRELLKTHKAKQDILAELSQSFQDEPDNSKDAGDWNNTSNPGFDLSKKELSFAREQLVKDYLNKNGFSLDSILEGKDEDTPPELAALLSGVAGLANDIETFESADETGKAVLLASFKRGELSEPAESADIDKLAEDLRKRVASAINKYNNSVAKYDDNLRIADWNLTLDQNGNTVVDIKTKGNDTDADFSAEHFINSLLSGNEEIAETIFEAHDDEHGDVKEYKHQLVLTKDGYSIESPEADKAALAEMQAIGGEIFGGLGQYFNSLFGSNMPMFGLVISDDGKLSLDAESTGLPFAKEVNEVLKLLNDTDNPNRILPDTLNPIAEKLLDYQEAASKLHTKYSK